MRVSVKNLLRPAQSLAFIFGTCPYRKFDEITYRRSTIGAILQLIYFSFTAGSCVHIARFYLPKALVAEGEFSSLSKCTFFITNISYMFLALWLSIHRIICASKMLRCLQLADEVNGIIHQISDSKQRPLAFYIAIVISILYLIRLQENTFNIARTSLPVLLLTIFPILYCETLVLEFVTVAWIAMDTINKKLQSWQAGRIYDINDLKKLQYLYLKTAYLVEIVDDTFGISWMVSFLSRSVQIILISNFLLKLSIVKSILTDDQIPAVDYTIPGFLLIREMGDFLRCFYICYSLHQPAVKKLEMISILDEMMNVSNDNEATSRVSNTILESWKLRHITFVIANFESKLRLNEFSLQVSLRRMELTAGGFFYINLHRFREFVGTWCTLLVVAVQSTDG